MQVLKKKYNPGRPDEVRQFAKEISRMSQSGVAGANQARRAIDKLSQQPEGRKLLAQAAKLAHLDRQSIGQSLSSVRVNTGGGAPGLGAAAFSAGSQVAFGNGSSAGDPKAHDLLAHELTHVVQQGPGQPKK